MDFFIKYIVPPVVGAIIGLFTNWIAIKMLFRPYSEKRIFGIKLPFTPGLIPKERENLSKKVGDTIGSYLLTQEVLAEEIMSDKNKEKLNLFLDENLSKVFKNDYTVNNILDETFKENKNKIVDSIIKFLEENISNLSDKSKENILNFITDKILLFIKTKNLSKEAPMIKAKVEKLILEFEEKNYNTENIKLFLSKKIDEVYINFYSKDYLVKDIISEENAQMINTEIKKLIPDLSEKIENFINENPEIDNIFKNLIYTIIEENVNGFAMVFISRKKIYESIKNNVINYFKSEENQILLENKIDEFTGNLLERYVISLFSKINIETRENFKNKIINLGIDLIESNLINKGSETVNNFIEKNKNITIENLIIKINPLLKEDLEMKNFIKINISKIINTSQIELKENIPNIVNNILKFNVSNFIKNIGYINMVKYKEKLLDIIFKMVEKVSFFIVKHIDIPEIVEKKLNELSLEEGEKIILSVVDKELKAITYLGGVLGFVIGLLQLLPLLF